MSARWMMLLGAGVLAGCPANDKDGGDTDSDVVDTDTIDTEPGDSDSDTNVDSDTDGGDSDSDIPTVTEGLMITEVGHYDDNVMYVELCNPTDAPVSLGGWRLGRLPTGLGSYEPVFSVELRADVTLQPGEAYVLARDVSSQLLFTDLWGPNALPDQYDANVAFGNGNDPYLLFNDQVAVDIFGDVSETVAWYTNQYGVRDESLTRPNGGQWDAAEWAIRGDWDEASPGRCLGAVDSDIPVDSFRDTFDTSNRDTYDTEPYDTQVTQNIVPASSLVAGDVVVTEFNAAPNGCEYLAFVVTGISITDYIDAFDIRGLAFVDQAGNSYTISGPNEILARPGQEMIAIPSASAGTHCTGLAAGAIAYTSFDLSDNGDTIIVRNASGVLDQVSYAGWLVTQNVSWNLDLQLLAIPVIGNAATANDLAANWCPSFTDNGYGVIGSPTIANDDCDAAPGGDTADTLVTPPDSDVDTLIDTLVTPPLTLADLAVGDLVITEFLANPATAGCSTSTGFEYVEVANTTTSRVDLDGLVVGDGVRTATVSGESILEPGTVAVLYPGLRTNHCFANNLIVWNSFSYTDTLALDNAAGVVTIGDGTVTFDTVDYRAWSPAPQLGQSWNLSASLVDAATNDSQNSWCFGGYPAGPGNIGTPGGTFPCN